MSRRYWLLFLATILLSVELIRLIEAKALVKRDRPICNASFGRPRTTDCEVAAILIADNDELFTIVPGRADPTLRQHNAPWLSRPIGRLRVCLGHGGVA